MFYPSDYPPQFIPHPPPDGPPYPISAAEQNVTASSSTNEDIITEFYSYEDIHVNDKVISLGGVFQVLSHCYATPMFVHRKRYRSVEHYVCQKFFCSLKFNLKAVEKVVTTTDPRKLHAIVSNILRTQYPPIPEDVLLEKRNKMNKWYERGMRKKFGAFPALRQLLLATGDALIIETNNSANKLTSAGVSEAALQFLLTKHDVTAEKLLHAFAHPDTKSFTFRELGQNLTGFMLMRLRNSLKQSNETPLDLFERIPVVSSLDYASGNIACFTCTSVLHPKYLSPIMVEGSDILYPSVDHYLFTEGSKFLCFPPSVLNRLMHDSKDDVRFSFVNEIWNRFPDPSKLLEWFSRYHDEILKIGCRAKFEQHPELLRVLLETSDSLLCYCHRYMTANGEWTIGMRESELREWKHHNRFSNGDLIDMMLSNASKRPPFVGGNRLGFILMELRREFRLKGCQSHLLPLLISNSNNEILFGDATGLETGDEFDSNSTPSKYLLWPSPFIIQCKRRGLNVWYPGKRHLSGFYDEGEIPDIKRQRNVRYQCVHPEYVTQIPFGKVYSFSPELLNLANDADALKAYVVILLRSVFRLTSEINEQNQMLRSNLDDVLRRNELANLASHAIEEIERDEERSSSPTPSAPAAPAAPTFPVYHKSSAKLKALEAGFVSMLLTEEKNDNSDKTTDAISSFDIDHWDEAKTRDVIENFYGHLDPSERLGAADWLQRTMEKMGKLLRSSSPSSSAPMYNLKTFVPVEKRNAKISGAQFF